MSRLPSLHSPFWAPDPDAVISTATEAMVVAALGVLRPALNAFALGGTERISAAFTTSLSISATGADVSARLTVRRGRERA